MKYPDFSSGLVFLASQISLLQMNNLLFAQVWDIVLCNDDKRLITGSADSELRVWDITYKDQVRVICRSDNHIPYVMMTRD